MASIFCCFRGCASFLDLGFATPAVPIKKQPTIALDQQQIGTGFVEFFLLNFNVFRSFPH